MHEPLIKLAKKHGWSEFERQINIGLISFVKTVDGRQQRVNVYTTKMTVATSLYHPKKGKTQMYRKKVSDEMMEQIFINPRVHTGRGYSRR